MLCRLLSVFDFAEVPDEKVDFDDFPIILMVQKGLVKLRLKVREGATVEMRPAANVKT